MPDDERTRRRLGDATRSRIADLASGWDAAEPELTPEPEPEAPPQGRPRRKTLPPPPPGSVARKQLEDAILNAVEDTPPPVKRDPLDDLFGREEKREEPARPGRPVQPPPPAPNIEQLFGTEESVEAPRFDPRAAKPSGPAAQRPAGPNIEQLFGNDDSVVAPRPAPDALDVLDLDESGVRIDRSRPRPDDSGSSFTPAPSRVEPVKSPASVETRPTPKSDAGFTPSTSFPPEDSGEVLAPGAQLPVPSRESEDDLAAAALKKNDFASEPASISKLKAMLTGLNPLAKKKDDDDFVSEAPSKSLKERLAGLNPLAKKKDADDFASESPSKSTPKPTPITPPAATPIVQARATQPSGPIAQPSSGPVAPTSPPPASGAVPKSTPPAQRSKPPSGPIAAPPASALPKSNPPSPPRSTPANAPGVSGPTAIPAPVSPSPSSSVPSVLSGPVSPSSATASSGPVGIGAARSRSASSGPTPSGPTESGRAKPATAPPPPPGARAKPLTAPPPPPPARAKAPSKPPPPPPPRTNAHGAMAGPSETGTVSLAGAIGITGAIAKRGLGDDDIAPPPRPGAPPAVTVEAQSPARDDATDVTGPPPTVMPVPVGEFETAANTELEKAKLRIAYEQSTHKRDAANALLGIAELPETKVRAQPIEILLDETAHRLKRGDPGESPETVPFERGDPTSAGDPTIAHVETSARTGGSLRAQAALRRKRGLLGDVRYVLTVTFGVRKARTELTALEAKQTLRQDARKRSLITLGRAAATLDGLDHPALGKAREGLMATEDDRSQHSAAVQAADSELARVRSDRTAKAKEHADEITALDKELVDIASKLEPLEKEVASIGKRAAELKEQLRKLDAKIANTEMSQHSVAGSAGRQAIAADIATLKADRIAVQRDEPKLAAELDAVNPRIAALEAKRSEAKKRRAEIEAAEAEDQRRAEELLQAIGAKRKVVDRAAGDAEVARDKILFELGERLYVDRPKDLAAELSPIDAIDVELGTGDRRAMELKEIIASVDKWKLARGIGVLVLVIGAALAVTLLATGVIG